MGKLVKTIEHTGRGGWPRRAPSEFEDRITSEEFAAIRDGDTHEVDADLADLLIALGVAREVKSYDGDHN